MNTSISVTESVKSFTISVHLQPDSKKIKEFNQKPEGGSLKKTSGRNLSLLPFEAPTNEVLTLCSTVSSIIGSCG
jgi:hypothetical protein